MINVAVCLYIQPFKAMSANIIEAFLAADVLILLLMRETEYFKTFEYKNDSVISIHSSLLIPGYYIPLAFCILASCVSAILNIRWVYRYFNLQRTCWQQYDTYNTCMAIIQS